MTDIPELFPVATVYPPAPTLDVYIVFAYWSIGGWWKMFREQHLTPKEAQEFVDKLPLGYTERKIYHVKGDKDERPLP